MSQSVEDYINQFDGESKRRLISLRKMVHGEVPDAEEGIMYGLVGYKLQKKPLVYFGAFSQHIGVYATPLTHTEFADELSKYKQGKGSVQFPLDQPLPDQLIRRMVRFKKEQLLSS